MKKTYNTVNRVGAVRGDYRGKNKSNKEFIKHTRAWFVARIGSKIMREESNFKGLQYDQIEFEIRDFKHATALFIYQTDYKLRYSDI